MITPEQLETFRSTLENAFRGHKKKENSTTLGVPCIRLEMGKKNCRVVKYLDFPKNTDGSKPYDHANAYCFIDLATGDILKPASFKAPVKGARGNILTDTPLKGCGPYGVEYKRGASYGGFTYEGEDKIESKTELPAPPAEIVI